MSLVGYVFFASKMVTQLSYRYLKLIITLFRDGTRISQVFKQVLNVKSGEMVHLSRLFSSVRKALTIYVVQKRSFPSLPSIRYLSRRSVDV
jgi:hypothetical protein